MYKLFDTPYSVVFARSNPDGSLTSFIKDPANTDYQQFLQHLAQGLPVEAVDGTAMTESEIAALYQTLTQPGT